MTTTPHLWWQTGVIYQVYPRSYKDTSGNGVGDLRGIIEKLDYLSDTLGVDAVWLSPIYPSPMADFGYDVADYTGIHPLFGDLATFDELLAGLHRRGLKLIIDWVPNHSSDRHPWFIESRSSRANPRRDWYVWADAKADGSPPNNWQSLFGGPAWEWDKATGQYYLHSFLKEQPDLNWRNPEVKAAMLDTLRFWLERGVDGFRVDVAHFVMKDPAMRDNPPAPDNSMAIHRSHGDYDKTLHLYDKGHPDVHQAYREVRQVLDAYSAASPRMMVGEIHIGDWREWASYYGENLDEFHLPFNFSLLGAEWSAAGIRERVDALEASLPAGAWPNYVLGNHDESRLASRYGPEQTRIAALLLLTLRGTPTLYYGDELGMADVPIPPERRVDPYGLRIEGVVGRDPCRTPMQWSGALHAGFSAPDTPDLWLPLAGDYQERNVERQLADPDSLLNLYRRLLAWRKVTPALQWGDYQPLDDAPPGCFAYLRQADSQRILVILNFSGATPAWPLPSSGKARLILSTHPGRTAGSDLRELALHAHEGLAFELID